jgi:hypothetical protein
MKYAYVIGLGLLGVYLKHSEIMQDPINFFVIGTIGGILTRFFED